MFGWFEIRSNFLNSILLFSSSLRPGTKGLPAENNLLATTSAYMMALNQNLAHIKNSSSVTV